MAWYECLYGGGGGSVSTLLQGLDEVTALITYSLQNKTVTLDAEIGDLLIRYPGVASGSVTGADLLYANTSPSANYIGVYKATSTNPVFVGGGSTSTLAHFKNSKRITDAITGFDTANTATNANVPNVQAGDLILINSAVTAYTTLADVLDIGNTPCRLFKALSANAKLYKSGNNYPIVAVHLS